MDHCIAQRLHKHDIPGRGLATLQRQPYFLTNWPLVSGVQIACPLKGAGPGQAAARRSAFRKAFAFTKAKAMSCSACSGAQSALYLQPASQALERAPAAAMPTSRMLGSMGRQTSCYHAQPFAGTKLHSSCSSSHRRQRQRGHLAARAAQVRSRASAARHLQRRTRQCFRISLLTARWRPARELTAVHKRSAALAANG